MPDHRHVLLVEPESVARLALHIRNAPEDAIVAHDTETAAPPGLPFPKPETAIYAGAYVQGISVALSAGPGPLVGYYVPVAHKRGNTSPAATRALCEALSTTRALHLLHNAPFDWAGLEHMGMGYSPSRRTVDTQSAAWLGDENRKKALKYLGELFTGEDAGKEQRELNEVRKSPWENQTQAYKAVREAFPEIPVKEARAMARRMRTDRSWTDLTTQEMAPYAGRDATMTYDVGEALVGRQGLLSPSRALSREMDVLRITYNMTKKGLGVDIDALEAAGRHHEAEAELLRNEFAREHGVKNPGSDDQIKALLYDRLGLPILLRTEKGAPSVAAGALEQLQGHPVAAMVLAYRRHVKAVSTYARGFVQYAERSHDGRVHGAFRPTGTVTGRLSSSGPNMQNIPRADTLPHIRKAFYRTEPGIERSGFDLKSAELWVTASITMDPVLTEVLMSGANLHSRTMVEVFGGEPDKTRREYTLSKNVNYGIEYGAGIEQIMLFAAKAGYAPAEARHVAYVVRDGHKRTFAKQHAVAERLADKARELGYLPLHPEGRVRHFRGPFKTVAYYTALNALVQGGVGEFMKDVMIEVDRAGYGELLVLQIHDELVFDHPAGMRDDIKALLTRISHDINPFRFVLEWDDHAWSEAA